MLGVKKNQRTQDRDITNVGSLKLVEQDSSTKSEKLSQKNTAKPSQPRKRAKISHPLPQDPVASWQKDRDEKLKARIASRAFEIYEERCLLGAPLQDWLRAEREVLAEMEYEG